MLAGLLVLLLVPDVLQRAIDAFGGQPSLAKAQSISIVMLGTQDQNVIGQGYFAEKPTPQRQQDTLIIDLPNRRAAMRTEGVQSDGSPTSWLWTTLGDSGTQLKLKTGRVTRMNAERSAVMFEQFRWLVPQLAIGEMMSRPEKLNCSGTSCTFETAAGAPFKVFFDRDSGLVAGYDYAG